MPVRTALRVIATTSIAAVSGLFAPAVNAAEQPERPRYDNKTPITRHATRAEREWAAANPFVPTLSDGDDVPQGPLSCPGEYAPADGIVFAWEGGATLNALTAQLVKHVTTTGQAKAYIVCDTASIATTARSNCVAAGADTNRIFTIVRTADTIWLRDYGPRYTYEGDVRVVIDHTYNILSRTNDNSVPIGFAAYKKHKLYTFPMIHGGGNYHLNSIGKGHYTRLIANENPQYTDSQINQLWLQYWGVDNTLHNPYRTSVDGTQHIDMWMQILGDNKVIVSDWPNNSGSVEDVISDNAAALLNGLGWQVARTPSFSIGGTHYTYTNMIVCNKLAIVPQYTNASITMPNPQGGANLTVSQINANVITTYQNLLGPEYTVVGVNCESIVGLAGVIHCIVMHVPVNKNGENPGAYLRSPNGNAVYNPGQTVEIKWISDDDVGVSNVDLQLSTNGGEHWMTFAESIPDTGSYMWTVPSTPTTAGRIRVVARDAQGNTGSDLSDANFTINPPAFIPVVTATAISDPFGSGTNNGNNRAEPGETRVRLTFTVRNDGALAGVNNAAKLTSNSPTVTVIQNSAGYADLAPAASGSNTIPFIVSIHNSHPCGSPIDLSLSFTHDAGVSVAGASVPTGVPGGPGAPQTVSYTTPAIAIPDGTGASITANLMVSGIAGRINDLNFRFDGPTCSTTATSTTVGLNHSYVGDLRVTLISPSGTSVVIIDTPGATGPDTNSGNNFCNTTLDDSATNPIQTAASSLAPFTGSWKPANPLSAFNIENPNGLWQLRVLDIITPDSGTLRRWSLIITPQMPDICTPANSSHCVADIADDIGLPLPSANSNGGVNEGDYNLFFMAFFSDDPLTASAADIADDTGVPHPSMGSNGGVNEGDYNCFFQTFFNC